MSSRDRQTLLKLCHFRAKHRPGLVALPARNLTAPPIAGFGAITDKGESWYRLSTIADKKWEEAERMVACSPNGTKIRRPSRNSQRLQSAKNYCRGYISASRPPCDARSRGPPNETARSFNTRTPLHPSQAKTREVHRPRQETGHCGALAFQLRELRTGRIEGASSTIRGI